MSSPHTEQPKRRPLLCRLGLHARTTIPRSIWAAAEAAGLRSGPLWYVGGQMPPYCRRDCGWGESAPSRKDIDDLWAEIRAASTEEERDA